MLDENGNEVEHLVEIPEPIHTYAAWKELGYQVKKGEKAVTSFTIWKYAKVKHDVEDDDEQNQTPEGRLFMKKAFFFKRSQVEAI